MSHRLPLADIQFIADFATFARSKGDEEYDFGEPLACALAQFMAAHPMDRAATPWGAYWDFDGWEPTYGSPLECALNPREAHDEMTFGALADRLEALIADAPAVSK